MKYLKVLENEAALQAFKNGSEYVEPNICYLKDVGGIRWKAWEPVMAGDVAYWDGYRVKTAPFSEWNPSLGTPVGVVVVPKGFAPDGKPRIISLLYVDKSGNTSTSTVKMAWGPMSADTSLTNFDRYPTTDNNGSTSTGSANSSYLPSDIFTGTTSFVDPKAKYKYSDSGAWAPSPYLGDVPNPEYNKEIYNGNALSDFNGLSNTETLVGLGTDYIAANACWKYNDGVSNLQWYLPAMGELGYLMPRFKEISETIAALGGVAITKDYYAVWSSSERNRDSVGSLLTPVGNVSGTLKYADGHVRPFAIL